MAHRKASTRTPQPQDKPKEGECPNETNIDDCALQPTSFYFKTIILRSRSFTFIYYNSTSCNTHRVCAIYLPFNALYVCYVFYRIICFTVCTNHFYIVYDFEGLQKSFSGYRRVVITENNVTRELILLSFLNSVTLLNTSALFFIREEVEFIVLKKRNA